MEFIYCRVSTDKQDTDNQLHNLKLKFPDAEVIEETVSGVKDKPSLNALLARLSPGDVLVVQALDRLGRHARKALALLEELSLKNVKIVSLREGVDTTTASGKMMASVMLAFAEMERNVTSERTKYALAAKKAEALRTGSGWRCGPHNTIMPETIAEIRRLRSQGLTMREIQKQTSISLGRICQLLKAA